MRIVVIGGGISGLACALRLRQLGLEPTLLERSERVGGVIETVTQDGFLFEAGPQSILATPLLAALFRELGLEDELLRADSRAPRYILVGGRLHAVPMAPPALLTSSLLGPGTKLRLLTEPLRRSRPPQNDESVAEFVRRKFGAELLERLVGPFVSGVFAGDPEKLSLRSAFPEVYRWEKVNGSVIRGAMKSRPAKGTPRPQLCSFRQGNATLMRRLREKLGEALRLKTSVESARRGKANGNSRFELQVAHHGHDEGVTAEAVIVATPTVEAGTILAGVSPRFAELLRQIEYAPVVQVAGGYRRDQVAHSLAGFGFLVPRTEKMRLLGTVWSSSLFPGRAPQGMVSVTSFAGGATDPAIVELSEDLAAAQVEKEVAAVLGVNGSPAIRMVRRYSQALPQYNLGHGAIVSGLREELNRFPGLFLAGNYLDGPSVGACVEQSFRTAEAVQAYLAGRT